MQNGKNNFRKLYKMIVLDTSYTYKMIRERGIEQSVTCRDLNGFFEHVWSVHPFATIIKTAAFLTRSGSPVQYEFNERHSFIEGKIGRFKWLNRLPAVNFLTSQLLLFFHLLRLSSREQVSIIRAGDPLYLGLFGLALSKLSGAALVIRVNGNYDQIRANVGKPIAPGIFSSIAIEKMVEKFVFNHADLVVALNQDNARFALENGAKQVTIFRLGNLLAPVHQVDPSERAIDNSLLELLQVERGRFLLCVGRLEPVKLPADAIKALSIVNRSGFDHKLLMVGDGSMRAELATLAESLGLGARVHIAGNQDQKALAQLLVAASVVISPLTGRALSEAALAGAPIVAYDLDWQSDLIKTGETGELVPFREVELMGQAVVRMLSNPNYARKMGVAARKLAQSMLDPENLDENERRTYREVLQHKYR